MVDVSAKVPGRREAQARAFVVLSQAVLAALPQNPKGNPLEVARFAGIQAAKRTADLIPMCHPLPLSFVDVSATVVDGGIEIYSTAATVAGTGVEMEAMTAAAVAALTVYDMCKALDKSIEIREVVLIRKSGGEERGVSAGEVAHRMGFALSCSTHARRSRRAWGTRPGVWALSLRWVVVVRHAFWDLGMVITVEGSGERPVRRFGHCLYGGGSDEVCVRKLGYCHYGGRSGETCVRGLGHCHYGGP